MGDSRLMMDSDLAQQGNAMLGQAPLASGAGSQGGGQVGQACGQPIPGCAAFIQACQALETSLQQYARQVGAGLKEFQDVSAWSAARYQQADEASRQAVQDGVQQHPGLVGPGK